MLPFIHKVRVISRIALIQRYGLYTRPQQRTRPLQRPLSARNLHTTQPAQMAQLSNEPVVDVMQKLENSPEAMVAVTKFLKVAHQEGFNETLTSGRMPSRMELLKLYSNPTMRRAAEDMMEAFNHAGIQFDQETALKLVKNLPDFASGEPGSK